MGFDLVGEQRTVGMGVERSIRSSSKSFRLIGLMMDSDIERSFGVSVSGSKKDQEVYSRSLIRTL